MSQTKRGRGRPKITDVFISAEKIAEYYSKCHSMRKTAKQLGIGVRTVFKYVNEVSKPIQIGGEINEDWLEKLERSPVALELKKLPQPIPRTITGIYNALEERYTYDTIRYYLRSRASACEENLRKAGSLTDIRPIHLRDIYGRVINTGMIEMYLLTVNPYTLVVTINATLKFGGKVTFRLAYASLLGMLKEQRAVTMPPK
jgi:hypothetical protein